MKEMLINVIKSDMVSDDTFKELCQFHTHGYDNPPDSGYNIFIETKRLKSICEEMASEELPFMVEVLKLDLPHLVTMICSGYNDIIPD